MASRTTLVLDADGLSKLARGDRRVREMIRQEVSTGRGALVLPWVAVIQRSSRASEDVPSIV